MLQRHCICRTRQIDGSTTQGCRKLHRVSSLTNYKQHPTNRQPTRIGPTDFHRIAIDQCVTVDG